MLAVRATGMSEMCIRDSLYGNVGGCIDRQAKETVETDKGIWEVNEETFAEDAVIFDKSQVKHCLLYTSLSGAVTNTPGLGAAQQAFSDLRHIDAPSIAAGYAIAYPMGVLGVCLLYTSWA